MAMILYLMRHGIAEDPKGFGSLADAERPLTAKGRERVERISESFRGMGCRPDQVWSSPLLRARQTADLMAGALDRETLEMDCLAPGADPRNALRELLNQPGLSVLLVGHMPDLALLASFFLPGIQTSGIRFRRAAIAEIECEDPPALGAGRLNWLMQPRQFLRTSDSLD